MDLQNFKDKYQLILKDIVQWGDLDAFQHVNNTVYFRYFERVRIAYFERFGLMQEYTVTGVGPVLASTRCRYRLPLYYPDTIYIGTYITELESDRFLMKYGIYSENENALVAEGEGFIIYYNYKTRVKADIPVEQQVTLKQVCKSPSEK